MTDTAKIANTIHAVTVRNLIVIGVSIKIIEVNSHDTPDDSYSDVHHIPDR